MVSIQACTNFVSTQNLPFSIKKTRIVSVNHPVTYLKKPTIVLPKLPNIDLNNNVVIEDNLNGLKTISFSPKQVTREEKDDIKIKLYAILEAIKDRIEMHNNVKEQRDNWNSLLLNSINMLTLTATTMVGVSTMFEDNSALKVSSTVLFLSATGLIMIMNKIQPSQLVQEQRNATRLFKQLRTQLETKMALKKTSHADVEGFMEKVLALDRAYPLPLLGAMLEKFPETYEPAVWWPKQKKTGEFKKKSSVNNNINANINGWSKELEDEMRDIVEVIDKKDIEDYVRLGNKALKLNKVLAVAGPVLTGIAAVGAGLSGYGGGWGGVVAAVAGSMAGVVNTIEHGGQVGMVFEMYRNCGGFFSLLKENVESNLNEGDYEKRENGELFEMKMGLKLGRSLSELKELANKSRSNGGFVDEFVSKLF